MKYHTFDRLTAAYIATEEAQPSPEEPGVFLLPAWATFEPLPAPEQGKYPYLVDGKWKLKSLAPQAEAANVIGTQGTVEVKSAALYQWAAIVVNGEARKVGFEDGSDALTYLTGPETHRQRVAIAYRDWRGQVMGIVDNMITICDEHKVFPTIEEFLSAIPAFVPPTEEAAT